MLPHTVIQTAASEPKLLLAQLELCEDVMLVAVGPWALHALVRVTAQWECAFYIIRQLANQMKCSDEPIGALIGQQPAGRRTPDMSYTRTG